MNLELRGAVALITGSSKGIGFAIAKAMSEEGCKIILNGRSRGELQTSATQLGAKYVVGDVSKEVEAQSLVEAAIDLYGRLDILVCNVGSGTSIKPGDETASEWIRMLDLNLSSATNIVRAVRPKMKAQGGGSILCISSICGSAALGAPIAYSAAKAALNSFVRGSARLLAPENIRINALAPGNILFEGSSWERKVTENPEAVKQMLASEVALNRFGTPDEIAAFSAFLCSPKASFATGSVYVLDGGQLRA